MIENGQKHIVYKFVHNNEIIYIGKSDVGFSRIHDHGRVGDNICESGWDEINSSDIYYAEMLDSKMTDIFESELIRRYKPKYNTAKTSDWAGIPLPEPTWVLYNASHEQNLADLKKELASSEKRADIFEKAYFRMREQFEDAKKQIENIKQESFSAFKNHCASCAWQKRKRFLDNLQEQEGDSISLDGPYSFEDVIKKYRDGEQGMCYFSTSRSANGKINCKKIIYTNDFDMLDFEFEQNGTDSYHGTILSRRDNKTMTNWNVVRCWINRGSNEYFREI